MRDPHESAPPPREPLPDHAMTIAHIRCSTCGHEIECKPGELIRVAMSGWPICCGFHMEFLPATRTQNHRLPQE